MLLAIVVSMLMFGSAAYVGIEAGGYLGARMPGRREPPSRSIYLQASLIAVTAAIGAVLASRGVSIVSFLTVAFVCVSLCAAWWSDVSYGVVPDALVIAPLAVVLLDAVFRHQWGLLFAGVVTAVPFGVVALITKGRGIGRTDGELAALGGAMLGLQTAILAYVFAFFALFAVNTATKKRGSSVAATPYLAAGIVAGMLKQVLLG